MSGDLKPGTLYYVKGHDPYCEGRVVEVIGPYMGTDCDPRDQNYEVWAGRTCARSVAVGSRRRRRSLEKRMVACSVSVVCSTR